MVLDFCWLTLFDEKSNVRDDPIYRTYACVLCVNESHSGHVVRVVNNFSTILFVVALKPQSISKKRE